MLRKQFLPIKSDAARSWGGSAVLGVSPMSNCRGFPHERLHQDNVSLLKRCSEIIRAVDIIWKAVMLFKNALYL
ncbi:MAG: hypothetical protein F6K64_08805 [Moorea sp. SIO3A2]|nr:hypothetical protein [Moorena sp. SIO3A2]